MKNGMKRLSLFLLTLCLLSPLKAADPNARLGKWTISYNEANHSLSIACGTQIVLDNVCPEATYQDESGKTCYVSSSTLPAPTLKKGKGIISASFRESTDVQFAISFQLIDDYLLCDAQLTSPTLLKSNYLAPICINQPYRLFSASESNRMLKVPFDNDDFVRYHQYPFGNEMTSFEVGALPRRVQRRTHHWLSGPRSLEKRSCSTDFPTGRYGAASCVFGHISQGNSRCDSSWFTPRKRNTFGSILHHIRI